MKWCIAIFLILATSVAQPKDYEIISLDKITAKLLIAEYYRSQVNDPGITANLNEFTDKLLVNVENFSVKHNLEPIPLGNVTSDILLASSILYNGSLHGISVVERYKDAEANYRHDLKELTITFPLQFEDIKFLYNYEVHVLGMGPKGYLEGEITDFKFYLKLKFDIPNLTFKIEELRTTDSGHISVKIHGNITDLIFNILSEIVTTILHPLIQGIIENIIKHVANDVVDDINSLLYNITHPSAANITYVNEFTQYVLN